MRSPRFEQGFTQESLLLDFAGGVENDQDSIICSRVHICKNSFNVYSGGEKLHIA